MNNPTTRRAVLAMLLLGLLASCASTPPSNHYILRAVATPPDADSGLALGVGPISIPDYLQRDNFVFSSETNRLEINSRERWAEPLEEGIARVVSLNLAGLLQTQDVRAYPWHPRRQPEYAVKVRVLELDASDTQARLVAEWLLIDSHSDAPLERRITQLEKGLAPADAGSVAAAYSELFYQLSEQVAEAIRAQENSG